MAALVGSEVGLYYDSDNDVFPGDYLRTRTGRLYLVRTVRVQARGQNAGRKHIRAVVVDFADSEDTVHPLFWYSRG